MADLDTRFTGERMCFGPFCLSPGERLLTRQGEPVEIGGRSFDLLVVLTEQPGRVVSKRELLKRVWSDVLVEDGSLRFHMAALRKLLGDGADGARYIATQVGVGYAFVSPIKREGVAASHLEELARPTPPIGINLPARLPHLIGRESDVALLATRVPDTPLFSIVGAAGLGKTSVAIEIGHRLAAEFANRVGFVDFSMLENPGIVPSMIAGAMGVAGNSGDPLMAILDHIHDEPFLLILDNCEHVIDAAAAIVERIVAGAPGARILTTSREPLRVRAEHVLRLNALAFPAEGADHSSEALLAYPAVQLFCERATAANAGLIIDAEDVGLVAEMCRRLDGVALPIELAAVRAAAHGLAATARQLGERFSLGWRGLRTAQPRQQTVQAMLDWSYDRLSPAEQCVLERVSVFVGPFSLDAALEIATDAERLPDEVVAALDSLTSKSLLVPDSSRRTTTYRLLVMTRSYARTKLAARGPEAQREIARRHASYYLSELEAANREQGALENTGLLRQQLGNIRNALDWSFGAEGDNRIAVRLATASAPAFLALSQRIECGTWCARALELIKDLPSDGEISSTLEAHLRAASSPPE